MVNVTLNTHSLAENVFGAEGKIIPEVKSIVEISLNKDLNKGQENC